MLEELQTLACRYAQLQQKAAAHADDRTLRMHITTTLMRCLPAAAVTQRLVDHIFCTVHSLPFDGDPMHTGAIHAAAGAYLLNADNVDDPLLMKLHVSAQHLLSAHRAATREELRLVSLDALYAPGMLAPGIHTAYLRHRLGLDAPRLSNEEIAVRMHKSLVEIHELESALLTILASRYAGGNHA
ncbi:MAG: hypothetical protein IJB81_06490 [Clostridia bacterium]|nr:hypothetical protein [Clostridia bacterium]